MEAGEYKRFESYYGVINLVRTRRFQSLMDRLGSNRISKPAGWVLLYVMPVAAGLGFFLFLSELGILLSPRGGEIASYIRSLSPLANLGLPGINPYLPIVDGWIALVIAMIIHEGAHGIVARSLGLPVKSSGLLFFLIVPIGAFVDVDETAIKTARPSYAGRVLAAGAGINLVVGLLCLLLLFGFVSTMRPAVDGVGITGTYAGYPAAQAGIRPGDFIVAVNGVHYDNTSALETASWYKVGNNITVSIWRNGAVSNYSITLASLKYNNTQTGQISYKPFMGITDIGYSSLQGMVSAYTGSFTTRPSLYLCIPTLPACQNQVPFSDTMSLLYTSSFGSWLVPLSSLLYWIFFLNFNLAIFNALPIYPLDGGQAYLVGVKALGRGKLSESTAMRITSATTLAVLALILGVLAGPYFL